MTQRRRRRRQQRKAGKRRASGWAELFCQTACVRSLSSDPSALWHFPLFLPLQPAPESSSSSRLSSRSSDPRSRIKIAPIKEELKRNPARPRVCYLTPLPASPAYPFLQPDVKSFPSPGIAEHKLLPLLSNEKSKTKKGGRSDMFPPQRQKYITKQIREEFLCSPCLNLRHLPPLRATSLTALASLME